MEKKTRYDWDSMKKEFEERLKKAVPSDMKNYVGIIDAKGYCPNCGEKKVLFLDRSTKKSYCAECMLAVRYEPHQFTPIEYGAMWQLARDLLYYTNEVIMELKYPDVDFSGVTPAKMKTYLLSCGWKKIPFKSPPPAVENKNVWKFTKTNPAGERSVEFYAMVPARRDLMDYKRATEIVIETISTFEKRSQYEVFLDLSR